MLRFFDDPLFQMFSERAMCVMTGNASEYGEVAATAERITDGDRDAWHREWSATADQVRGWAEESLARGHRVSAAEGFRRAATYDRIAFYPLYGSPVDPRLAASFENECADFARFAQLQPSPVLQVKVPYEGTDLDGYLCLVDDAGAPRPTLIGVNGYDSTVHEMYWSHAQPALRRGYNCLLVDGPGQGAALIRQGLHSRPDWEVVLRAVVDHAVSRPEVDPSRLAVMGWSLGGYYAPRGAGGEHRIAALIADPGQLDLLEAARARLPIPGELVDRLPNVDPAELEPYLTPLLQHPVARWQLGQRAVWVHGLSSLGEYPVVLSDYNLHGVVGHISCPTLVTVAKSDPIAAQAETLYEALTCPKTLARFTAADGADGHCEVWNRSRLTQVVFDWLDEVLDHRTG
ncbi:hypothetical protein DN069_29970 [Streptacidiphilus pinicola]|uniref:Alpha/beta hydrolase n=1 Tax=Streptacidiphilus pinicola TaxID=2219663 RepID=A0A2X0IET6_9ACTN|nr:alpha/beta fold hydrolase [Streptacidiphilus pinicola]RAG81951.1 hypothetical protein DN069_29970 [Streptacidiphilus pinicola]